MIAQIFTRLKLLFSQGVGTLIGAEKVQVRALDSEPLDNINRVEPYGYSYRPKPGCETYLLFPHGDRSYGVAIVIGDKRYQMTLVEGEVAIHDDEENWVHIKRGGIIEAKASTKVIADTPLFETTQDAKIGGNLLVKGQTISEQGYSGEGGSRAWLKDGVLVEDGAEIRDGTKLLDGLDVFGHQTCNGKDTSETHTHPVAGADTLGVN